jgi:hypothetical protein
VITSVEAAGFKLAGKSEINANPKDTRDHPEGVWALLPTLRLGDKDREKYVAIGESDRMTLKFVKVAKKAAVPVSKAAAPGAPVSKQAASGTSPGGAPAAVAGTPAPATKPSPAPTATPAPAAPAPKPAPAAPTPPKP